MTDPGIVQLIRPAPIIRPDDTIRRAAGLIRASDGSSLPVAVDSQIIGSVSERAIAGFLAQAEDGEAALDSAVASLVQPGQQFVSSSVSLSQAAAVFAATESDVLPAVDSFGSFLGVVYRRDVVGLMTKNLRPPTVAGMATPLGVYLTTGAHRSGANNAGLFLTGVSLMLMIIVAGLVVEGLQRAFSVVTGIPVAVYLASPPLTMRLNVYDLAFYVTTALTIVIMLLLLRLSPLSGYHAAEHMTVHAIETGEALTPDIVARMPRVHPRCGTNLLAAAGVFMILATRVSSQFTVLVALVVVVVGWRMVGGWLQYLVTTKNPSQRQLENGVAAGNELLERYQQDPHRQVANLDRIWNMGFLQTASGMAATIAALTLLESAFHIPVLRAML